MRVRAINGFAPVTSGMRLTAKEMVLSVPVLTMKYVWLAFVPAPLNYWHVYAPIHVLGWKPIVATALLLIYVVTTLWLRRAQPVVSFSLAWFGLTLIPALAIPKVSGNVFAERYLYIPSFGFCLLAAWGWLWAHEKASRPAARRAAYACLFAVFALYTVLVIIRIPDWHDTLTLAVCLIVCLLISPTQRCELSSCAANSSAQPGRQQAKCEH